MPRKAIDYSNTIIYKLCCNDPSITDVYVGHTTDFVNRKRSHKSICNNETNKKYNIYVYQFIREHGNWDNWSMIELEKINCIDGNEACKNERKHIELLGSTLNQQVPSRTPLEYREENRENLKERNQKYREENTDKEKERKRKYREENRDIILEKQQKKRELKKQLKLETDKLVDV